jgi:hypothetical protein
LIGFYQNSAIPESLEQTTIRVKFIPAGKLKGTENKSRLTRCFETIRLPKVPFLI